MSQEHYLKAVEEMDRSLPELLDRQMNDASREDHGGIEEPELGIATLNEIDKLLSVYFCPDSKYYRNNVLKERVLAAVNFLVRIQHEDGTIDLHKCNYHDPTFAAFRVWTYAPWLRFLRKADLKNQEREILEKVECFLRRTIPALQSGGFHTPNHRWVCASALAELSCLFGDRRCREVAEEYLEEGIDCNEDGLFSEKSLGVYNFACGLAMLILAENLKKPELMDYVTKVLDFALCFLEADGTLLNTFSFRQDRGQRMPAFEYYYLFKRVSVMRNDGRYAEAADHIFRNNSLMSNSRFNPLSFFLFHPELKKEGVKRQPLATVYTRYFEKSGIVRMHDAPFSLTFAEGSNEFLVVVLDKIDLRFRYVTTFFGRGAFVGERMRRDGNSYTLEHKVAYGYRDLLPKEKRSEKIPWSETVSLRKWIKIQRSETLMTLILKPELNGGELRLTTQGCKDVLTVLEILFPKEGRLSFKGDTVRLEDDIYLLKEGRLEYSKGNVFFEIGPGCGAHSFVNLRRDKPGKKDRISVIMTFRTPFDHSLRFSYTDGTRALRKKLITGE